MNIANTWTHFYFPLKSIHFLIVNRDINNIMSLLWIIFFKKKPEMFFIWSSSILYGTIVMPWEVFVVFNRKITPWGHLLCLLRAQLLLNFRSYFPLFFSRNSSDKFGASNFRNMYRWTDIYLNFIYIRGVN